MNYDRIDVRDILESVSQGKTYFYFRLGFYNSGRCSSYITIKEVELEITPEIIKDIEEHNGSGNIKIYRKGESNDKNNYLTFLRVYDYKIVEYISETEEEAIEYWNSIIHENIDFQRSLFEKKEKMLKNKLIKKGELKSPQILIYV